MTKDSTSLTLHWSPRSPFVRKVMLFAHETGLASRLTLVRSVVAMTTPNQALMRDNPLSKIPTLVLSDGSVLYDSAVICDYLDTLHAGPRRIQEWLAGTGPMPMTSGSTPAKANDTSRALVLSPSSAATSMLRSDFWIAYLRTCGSLDVNAPSLKTGW